MKRIYNIRSFGGVFAAVLVTLASLVGGCADNSTEPPSSDVDPVGYPGTVQISDSVSADEAASVRQNVKTNSADSSGAISSEEAADAVVKEHPDAEILGVNLDYDRSGPANYEVVIRENGKVYVVIVDRKNGNIVETSEIDNYKYSRTVIIKKHYIKCKDVEKKVRDQFKGDVVEVNLEDVEDRATYIIIILTRENRYVTVYIDAEDGRERKLKNNGDCDDDDHGDKHKNKRGRGHYRHGKGHGYGHHYHCDCQCDDDDDDNGNPGDDSTQTEIKVIPRDSARVIAASMIDSAEVLDIELNIRNDSTAFYQIDIERDSNRYDVTLDAKTGALVEIKQTSGDVANSDFAPQVQGDSLVSVKVARTAALTQVPGTVQSWKLEYDASDKKWMYTFEITTAAAGDVKKVKVDAKTGQVAKVE